MPIDPALVPLVELYKPMTSLDWAATKATELRAATEIEAPPPFEVVIKSVINDAITVEGRTVRLRFYRPDERERAPTIVFFHGGGWALGSIDMNDFACRLLAKETAMTLVSVGYNRAPESPYPQPIEDCYGAVRWVAANAGALRIDPDRLIVAGDSAGANLAAAVALVARDRRQFLVRHQLLLYPVTDLAFDTVSYEENEGIILSRGMMQWFWRQYIGERTAEEVPLAAVLRQSDLSGLPSATVVTAEYDSLRDEGEAYALKLAQAGVPVELVRALGMTHGFLGMAGASKNAAAWLGHVASRLRQIVI